MKTVVASPKRARAAAAVRTGGLGIALYDAGSDKLAGVGHPLREIARAHLPSPPTQRAWDFLSFALSVFAIDRFVLRHAAADGWTREIALELDLGDPEPWNPLTARIAALLRFLTGDVWSIKFCDGGVRPPTWHPKLTDRDCVCLFSGGLDSFIGAADLLQNGRRPLLVSQAFPKEGSVQDYLARQLRLDQNRFEGRAIERHMPPYEPSSRSRSILFFGYGIIAASAIARSNSPTQLFLPENGLISINPPFYRRRLGSLSTRTTHPYFIRELQAVLDELELGVELVNPYRGKTKGEMLASCKNQVVRKFAHNAYSCGKGKRLNQHCGRCVPCLIRRAAFVRAQVQDKTDYWAQDLSPHATYDDVFATRLAVEQLRFRDIGRWITEAGPLPYDSADRKLYVDVVRRGLAELSAFVGSIRWA